MARSDQRVAIVGLGYVGLPLLVEFGRTRNVIGFDLSVQRVVEISKGYDRTGEVEEQYLLAVMDNLTITHNIADLSDANIFIVAVPTPIDESNRPDMTYLLEASRLVGSVLKSGDIVVYESTVYPGATEEDCVSVLSEVSGLKYLEGEDSSIEGYYCGYSPERINPGDRVRRLPDIVKITSGSTPLAASVIDDLYREIIIAGTYRAPSIRVAEAAKVIENVQRDVNIALVNELAIIFNHLGIDTESVLEAAGTKWNFQPFRPGLVGGHCIGIDPYYLKHKAQSVGYHPEIISAVRRLNDSMGSYVVAQLVKAMTRRGIALEGARILVLGLAFKENCPDLRNSRVVDIVAELNEFSCRVDVYDPWVSVQEAEVELGISPVEAPDEQSYDAIVIAVAHREFREMGAESIRAFGKPNHILYDLKYVLAKSEADLRL
ncbi:MAG: nucleotide sugar dehydrogenase [Rhizobiaceae bacterium]|nr:nucleotide sugar dehydrogenase [Rhizobiaceae bacterium]